MTSLDAEFFEERDKEIEKWKSKGFEELHSLLSSTDFVLEYLEEVGIIQKKLTSVGLEDVDGYGPTSEWNGQFKEGACMTTFLPIELGHRIIEILEYDTQIAKRVERRRELYRKRIIAQEKNKSAEENKKVENREVRELGPSKNTHHINNDLNKTPEESENSASCSTKTSPKQALDEKNDNSTPLSSEAIAAVPSMFFLSALLFRYLGSSEVPGAIEWTFIALFSYSPIRYIFRAGMENVAGQFRALVMATFMCFVVGAGVSTCSGGGTSGSSCWYRVGCV